jgi:hypothetical protein
MRKGLMAFINLNRQLTNKFICFMNSKFGSIDYSEKYFYDELSKIYKSQSSVLELGGANRPLLSKTEVGYYIGIDVDNNVRHENIYHKYYCESVELFNPEINADLILSKYLLEHVSDNEKTFHNVEKWLNFGGSALHIMPLGFHPFSLCNKIIGNKYAKKLIPLLRPGSESVTGYKAYYNMCDSHSLNRLMKKSMYNYKVKYFFGADDYFSFFFPLAVVIHFFNRACNVFRLNIFASNAVLILRK